MHSNSSGSSSSLGAGPAEGGASSGISRLDVDEVMLRFAPLSECEEYLSQASRMLELLLPFRDLNAPIPCTFTPAFLTRDLPFKLCKLVEDAASALRDILLLLSQFGVQVGRQIRPVIRHCTKRAVRARGGGARDDTYTPAALPLEGRISNG